MANSRELGVQPLAAPCLCCSFVLLCRAVLFCGTLAGPPTARACSFQQCTLLMYHHCPLQSLIPPHAMPVGLLCWGRLPGSTMKEVWVEVCRNVQSRASGRLFVLSPFFVHTRARARVLSLSLSISLFLSLSRRLVVHFPFACMRFALFNVRQPTTTHTQRLLAKLRKRPLTNCASHHLLAIHFCVCMAARRDGRL